MPLITTAMNRMLDALAGVDSGDPITHISLHTDIPDDGGSDELTGGSPAYARQPISFDAAASGAIAKDASDPVFDVPAGNTVYFVGLWTDVSAGDFMGWLPVNGGTVQGYGTAAATGDAITSYAHGMSTGDRVLLRAPPGGSLPTGLSATVLYWVVNGTTDTFKVSLTSGGAAVDISADGELYFQKVVGETYGSQGTLTVDTLDLSLL